MGASRTRQALLALVVALCCVIAAEAGRGDFARYTGYCFYCCGLASAFLCGIVVVWFIIQSKTAPDEVDPWRKFEDQISGNLTEANATNFTR
mmetsp:Transcript_1654/g.3966  ORF Transcript_1654/g.3966 Transcript_1654/m.3966 type:complete len:92 (-) Transcript_1654:66-341(-)